jgi:hypothetical protein
MYRGFHRHSPFNSDFAMAKMVKNRCHYTRHSSKFFSIVDGENGDGTPIPGILEVIKISVKNFGKYL